MARFTIRLIDTATGPQVTVDYESEPDALGHEHEREHRAAVAQLLGMTEDEMDAAGIVVTREPVGRVEVTPTEGEERRSREAAKAKG